MSKLANRILESIFIAGCLLFALAVVVGVANLAAVFVYDSWFKPQQCETFIRGWH